ncbi:hypothetical protein [Marinomonas sp. THO17]|uniref:hypothetical protein n=1 Tax=Marinomonas sp. THO17 TaxID=3149048 RepID=UPI00336BF4BA
MPIANCLVSSKCQPGNTNLIDLWANASGQSSEQMTVTISHYDQQFGHDYEVIVNLYLPSLWSKNTISLLQTGLSKALSEHFSLPIEQVFIMTSLIDSGFVVESGEAVNW